LSIPDETSAKRRLTFSQELTGQTGLADITGLVASGGSKLGLCFPPTSTGREKHAGIELRSQAAEKALEKIGRGERI
jgi:hypothetical protein